MIYLYRTRSISTLESGEDGRRRLGWALSEEDRQMFIHSDGAQGVLDILETKPQTSLRSFIIDFDPIVLHH